MKYSDQLAKFLKNLGYSHFFYVGGGNIMHLTESMSRYLTGIPVIHEVAAGIAVEYFNEVSDRKALALVTAGPGLTNIITAISGSWLESRELLIIGGQVKTTDLMGERMRSRGIQEIDGVSLVSSTTKLSKRLLHPISSKDFYDIVKKSWSNRKGPVFIEIPLDIQAIEVEEDKKFVVPKNKEQLKIIDKSDLCSIVEMFNQSNNPILLIGGGVNYSIVKKIRTLLIEKKVPVMTTYNGADRVDSGNIFYLGRPNTWGQRASNIIIQESDLILAVGTRLGLQQTGFNWQEFGRKAKIIQIDIDKYELSKGHPIVDYGFPVDANNFLLRFLQEDLEHKDSWLEFSRNVINSIPRKEDVNNTGKDYISPYDFVLELEKLSKASDLIIPCSSGSAFTLTMSLFKAKNGQRIITNKSLASMGYGLSGAIGACIGAGNKRRTILIEGDGGFAQNLQEIGTANINKLNIKIFIFDDCGHASIRMTQKNYFNGKYLGCDINSGLGLPNWKKLFKAWNLECIEINKGFFSSKEFLQAFNSKGLSVFIVRIDPEQTYFPKISSRITSTGNMESNPIDKMTPELSSDVLAKLNINNV